MDCAYYSDDLLEVKSDPEKELKELLEARGLQELAASCPQCFKNQRKLVSTACSIYIHALTCAYNVLHAAAQRSAAAQHSLVIACLVCDKTCYGRDTLQSECSIALAW